MSMWRIRRTHQEYLPMRQFLTLLLFVIPITASRGQRIEPESPAPAAAAMRWRLVGPFRGGRVVAVTGSAAEPHTYYFGAVGGGVWKTTDGGIVWTPMFDAQPVQSIGAIALAPSDAAVLYVGTGESD